MKSNFVAEKNEQGFSLIEVVISLGIFLYVFSAIFVALGALENVHLRQVQYKKCSRTSMTLLIKRLTNATRVSIGSTTNSIYFEYLNSDQVSLKIVNNKMYLNSPQIPDLQFDECDVSKFDFDEKNKCLTIIYPARKTSTFNQSETVCALK